MQVFISWSGRQSHAVATALRTWLPKVLDKRVRPFVSSEDIDKGARGLSVIATELEESAFGIVVVTPSNVNSAWVNFEAGALGKSVERGRVAPLLVGMSDTDLFGPLKQFQNAAASDREAVLALVHSINRTQTEPLDNDTVATLFDAHWDELNAAISKALNLEAPAPEQKRSPEDVLDEVLTTVRSLQREVANMSLEVRSVPVPASPSVLDKLNAVRLREDQIIGTQSGAKTRDLLALILQSVGQNFTVRGRGDDFEVLLNDDMPPLSSDLLNDLRGLAASQAAVVTLTRSDQSGVRFDPDGTEYRRDPKRGQFVMVTKPTAASF